MALLFREDLWKKKRFHKKRKRAKQENAVAVAAWRIRKILINVPMLAPNVLVLAH